MAMMMMSFRLIIAPFLHKKQNTTRCDTQFSSKNTGAGLYSQATQSHNEAQHEQHEADV